MMPIWMFYDQTIMAITSVPETVYLTNSNFTEWPPLYSNTTSYSSGSVVKEAYGGGGYQEVWTAIKTMSGKSPSGFSGLTGESGWLPFRANANSGYSGYDLQVIPPDGQIIIIKDESGNASSGAPITIKCLNMNDRIDAKQSEYKIDSGYGHVVMYNRYFDGASAKNWWYIIGESGLSKPAS